MTAVLTGKRTETRPERDTAGRPVVGRHLAVYRPDSSALSAGSAPPSSVMRLSMQSGAALYRHPAAQMHRAAPPRVSAPDVAGAGRAAALAATDRADVPAIRLKPTARPARRLTPRSAQRLDRAVYRRRRLMAGGLFLLAIAAVLILAQLIQAGIGGGPLTATGAAAGPGMLQAGATEYVVRPGDTLWSIAAALEPGRDERPLVDQLAKETHGASLYPGQVIPLPTGH